MTTFTELISRIKPGREQVWVLPRKTLIINDGKGLSAWVRQDREDETSVTESAHVEKLMRVLRAQAAVCDAAVKVRNLESDYRSEDTRGIHFAFQYWIEEKARRNSSFDDALAALAREMEKELGDESSRGL